MTSKDNDTLPLPGFSQELSSNITVDEDFIPTSQPHSNESLGMSRNSENSMNKSTEEIKSISETRIDDTLPPEAVLNLSEFAKDKSTDFIPDTETKKAVVIHMNKDLSCKKKLPVFGDDIFKGEASPLWEPTKIPESPALDTQIISVLEDTTMKTPPTTVEAGQIREESIAEIIVNDSAETVDLEATPVQIKNLGSERVVEKLEISCSSSSFDLERCDETQIFDNSSVLLLNQSGGPERTENVSESTLGNDKTEKVNGLGSGLSSSAVKFSESFDTEEKFTGLSAPNAFPKQEEQANSNRLCTNSDSVITRKIDLKLTVSCLVTLNTKTNKVLHKIILNVNETTKPKPKTTYVDPVSDNTSDKSKRHSTSSSGSVYSDKMGPFALPKRVSVVSDQTDSSEEEFGSLLKKERRARERVPWSNEYLLPLKMDDIMLVSVENQELLKRPNIPSPKKPRNKHCNGVNHLKEILENSTSLSNSPTEESVERTRTYLSYSEEIQGKEAPESSEPAPPEEKKADIERETECSNHDNEEKEAAAEQTNTDPDPKQPDQTSEASEGVDVAEEILTLRDGLPIFARWSDKRYYSGVLSGCPKNDRWEVKFDDGTCKSMREDFIMPAAWLKVGALVFAIRNDKYESGQIVDIKKGDEANYVVELDTGKIEICVKISDLCLTDVMAGIVREKYKPLVGTPRAKSDIDFDNVLSGKRLREQRTPLRPVTVQPGSSGSSKKSSSKGKKHDFTGLKTVKETPQKANTVKKGGLKTENGHLVEDKVISADSPSGTEAGETPLRRNSKENKNKAKPRSLSYEAEETRHWKKKQHSWLAPDGTPIPGPSGVKFKKQKTKTTTEGSKEKKSLAKTKSVPESDEKSKRKRKLDESVEESVQKKSMKGGESKVRTRSNNRV